MRHTPQTFGNLIRNYRGNTSLRALAEQIGTPYTHISAFENAKRPVGKAVAKKLADAFGLTGQERQAFLTAAEVTSMANRPISNPRRKGQTNHVMLSFIEMITGMGSADFQDVVLLPKPSYDVIVTLVNGGVIGIELKRGKALVVSAPSVEMLPPPESIASKANQTPWDVTVGHYDVK